MLINISVRRPETKQRQKKNFFHTFHDVDHVCCTNQHLHGQGYYNSAYSEVKIRLENDTKKESKEG